MLLLLLLTVEILVPVLTPDAVPGGDGPSLLELDLFSLMVSNYLRYSAFTLSETFPLRKKPTLVFRRLKSPAVVFPIVTICREIFFSFTLSAVKIEFCFI